MLQDKPETSGDDELFLLPLRIPNMYKVENASYIEGQKIVALRRLRRLRSRVPQ